MIVTKGQSSLTDACLDHHIWHESWINQYRRKPETVMSLADFVEHVYMPFIEAEKRPSTVRGYRDMWDDHIATREHFCKMLMRELRTAN